MNKLTLDAPDIRILNAIQNHGQLSKTGLSEMVNLSPTSCWTRLAKLKKAGLIRGYYADIDISKVIDLTKVIVTISLKKHQKKDFKRFESHIESISEIVSCVATGGGFDYVMTVISPSLSSFQDTMEQLVDDEIGIDRYITYFVTREVKSRPLNLLKTLTDQ
ncbi:MAG: Lrp/AsnC family transcriptional regulator [Cocleimonas sp.]